MSARRPKKDRPRSSRKAQWLERLKRRRRRGPTGDQDMVIVPAGPGQEKMSEVLEDFVEPYLEMTVDEDSLRKLYSIAMLAWNAAILPEEQREAMIQDILGSALHDADPEIIRDARVLVEELIQRKLASFAANRRMIYSFELVDQGDRYHLSVLSTLGDPS